MPRSLTATVGAVSRAMRDLSDRDGVMIREFALAAACCVWPPSQRRNAAIAAEAAGIDWVRFPRVVERHRVPSLVWNGLCEARIDVPLRAAQLLKAGAHQAARASLLFCAEAIRLQRLLDGAGYRCAFIKGVTLATLGYGNVGLRHAKDIDLIVPAADLRSVGELLTAAGYRRTRPSPQAMSESQWALLAAYDKHTEWRHDQSGIELELHWRLTDIACLLDEPLDFTSLRKVEVAASAHLSTLPFPKLFVYLCVHGASHGWCRLKWLADIHALIAREPAEVIEGYYEAAKADRAERAVGQALLLCEGLFLQPLPDRLAGELHDSRVTAMLARIGLLCMTRGGAETELHNQSFGSTLVSASHLLLAGNLRSVLTELWRKGIHLEDVARAPLPGSLGIPYCCLLRIPLWLLRRLANGGASRRRGLIP